jgi:predicted short-subunit dehydrogenase-like oxidoreductase (DUF2520 family)
MTFSIIGTGNIACFFGSRLVAAGHRCACIYGRDQLAAKQLAATLEAGAYRDIKDIPDGEADICFLAVSDTAINSIASQLSFKRTVLIHTAGAVSLDAIGTAATDAAILWPIYSIIKTIQPSHRNIPCAYEASTEKADLFAQLAGNAITDLLFIAKYEQRKWLHLAAVLGNNFINHLMAICEQICAENDLPFATLLPIIHQTFDRMKYASPKEVQTGPAVRRDTGTIHQQLALLGNHPYWQKIYLAITESIQAPGSLHVEQA